MRARLLLLPLVLLLATACSDAGDGPSADRGGGPGGGDVCTEPSVPSGAESQGAVRADRPPVTETYQDGSDLVEMITCRGGVVGAMRLSGDYTFADWVSTSCRGMWEGEDFSPGDVPSFQMNALVHEDARLRGVKRVSFSIPAYDGPGTYEVTDLDVDLGQELPPELQLVEVSGTGTLDIEWADWGGTLLGARLHLIGSFSAEITGDVTLTVDVPIFGCDDVA